MEQIFVESNKTYTHGFLLKEQDLRRIIDLFNEQFKKISTQPVTYEFTMRFANGAIASTDEIETVLKQENEGSANIRRLEIKATQENNEKITQIKLEFENIDSDDAYGEKPIKHNIKGQSRDWVFVTSSLIEERITKIKKLNINSNYGIGRTLARFSSPIFMVFLMIAMSFSMVYPNSWTK